jgi:hypothetical protein
MSLNQSIKKFRESLPKWGAMGFVVVILATLVPISFILTSNPPLEESLQLDFNLLINSSLDESQYEATYDWVASSDYSDVDGTHIQWENKFADGSVKSSGEFSNVIFDYLYHIYIDWTELVMYANSTWTLSMSIVSFGFTFALTIKGTNTTVVEIVPSFKEVWITSANAAEFQEELGGVDELYMSCDVEFQIASDLLEHEFQKQNSHSYNFSDLTGVLNNHAIGTIFLY